MIDHLANRLEQFSCIAFFPPLHYLITLLAQVCMTAWKVGRFGGSATLRKRTLREQQLQIEHDKTTLLTKLDLYSHPRQAVTSYCKFLFFISFNLQSLWIKDASIIMQISTSAPLLVIVIILCLEDYMTGYIETEVSDKCCWRQESSISSFVEVGSHIWNQQLFKQSKSAVVWERQLVLIKSSLKVSAETKEIDRGKQEI